MSDTTTDSQLAVFVDRSTMRHERHYPHPIERVWDAVTMSEHLDVWLLPVSTVERRAGGHCSFSWGGPAAEAIDGTVTTFDPPRAVQYTFGHPQSYIRFELAEDGRGTRLWFFQSFAPGEDAEVPDDAYEGADRPAGADTPWRPGFIAGFHEFLDQLGPWLDGTWTVDDNVEYHASGAGHAKHRGWIDVYRAHIAATYPGA